MSSIVHEHHSAVLAAGAAAPDPATVIISKVAKGLASLGLWLHFSKHHSETTVRRVAFSKDGTQHYHKPPPPGGEIRPRIWNGVKRTKKQQNNYEH